MTKQPPEKAKNAMTGIAIDAAAQGYARELEDRECRTSQVTLDVARRAVSRRTGVGAGTLSNLRRGRIKGVRAWILDALRTALIKELEAECVRNEHEIAVLMAAGRSADCQQVAEIQADIVAKRATLKGEAS